MNEILNDAISFQDDIEKESIAHYGTPRHSGRYPWGSGDNPYQHESWFMSEVYRMREEGMTNNEIAAAMNMSSPEFRARITNAKEVIQRQDLKNISEMRDKGYTNVKIAEITGLSEGTVRNYIKKLNGTSELYKKADISTKTADFLKDIVKNKGMVDVGMGAQTEIVIDGVKGVSETTLISALKKLENDGYPVYGDIRVEQITNPGNNKTTIKVLCPPGTTKAQAWIAATKTGEVNSIASYDNFAAVAEEKHPGFKRTKYGMYFPESIDSKRIFVRYSDAEPVSGLDKDGIIELRRGVDDISLGGANYAQVRIAVDGTHYLKGMAMYSNDIPDGYDVIFNSHEPSTTVSDKHEVFKKLKSDPDNPFGAAIKPEDKNGQRFYTGKDGKEHLSVVNIVNQEGDWGEWSKTLSSQFLSKQQLPLIKKQLKLSYESKVDEFNDICALTNPVIKQKLLDDFASDCDASAVHLKAQSLPRQASHVILPIVDMDPKQVYAPKYKDGEEVVLIRYPHGGIFEIPRLTVNNKQKTAKDLLGNAADAIGINSKTAEQLSGADFDGDTVMVIPVSRGKNGTHIETKDILPELKDFRTSQYELPKDAPEVSGKTGFQKQNEMGRISNLITDMTLKGANWPEIARAVKHSMVIIDAEKHHLDWRQSEIDNDIAGLKEKYQGRPDAGASTLISRASAEQRISKRKVKYSDPDNPGSIVNGIDILTGEKVYKDAKEYYYKPIKGYQKDEKGRYLKDEYGKKIPLMEEYTKSNGETGTRQVIVGYSEKPTERTIKTTKMANASDAYDLIDSKNKILQDDGTYIAVYAKEGAYADYANKLKALANTARKEMISTPGIRQKQSAKETYSAEIDSLNRKLAEAIQNKPRERQAQMASNVIFKIKYSDNPNMSADEQKKIKSQTLAEQRIRFGAKKQNIDITDSEWEAIQAGAISTQKLRDIMNNTDMDKLKERAMPRDKETNVNQFKIDRMKSLSKNGYTLEEIANSVGLSPSTVSKYLKM